MGVHLHRLDRRDVVHVAWWSVDVVGEGRSSRMTGSRLRHALVEGQEGGLRNAERGLRTHVGSRSASAFRPPVLRGRECDRSGASTSLSRAAGVTEGAVGHHDQRAVPGARIRERGADGRSVARAGVHEDVTPSGTERGLRGDDQRVLDGVARLRRPRGTSPSMRRTSAARSPAEERPTGRLAPSRPLTGTIASTRPAYVCDAPAVNPRSIAVLAGGLGARGCRRARAGRRLRGRDRDRERVATNLELLGLHVLAGPGHRAVYARRPPRRGARVGRARQRRTRPVRRRTRSARRRWFTLGDRDIGLHLVAPPPSVPACLSRR